MLLHFSQGSPVMSEEQVEMLMVKALSKAQINPKTEELEEATVSPKEKTMALLVEETELEESMVFAVAMKQARKPQSYASRKLCPPTESLTGVKCRATM